MDTYIYSSLNALAQALVALVNRVAMLRSVTPHVTAARCITTPLDAKAPDSDNESDTSESSLTTQSSSADDANTLQENAKFLINDLLQRIEWAPLRIPENVEIRRLLQEEVDSWEVNLSPELKQRLVVGSCYLTQRCYPYGSFEQLHYTAFWTAYFVYAEDHCAKNLDRISRFSQCLLTRQKQDDPVLERFARHLEKMYDLYPGISCNLVSSATSDFLSAVYLEYTLPKDVGKDPLAPGFPLYLRLKTAAAIPFAYFLFPKSVSPDVSSYVKAIPDLELFITYINDIVSFYKEELAGDTYNFVHLQAATQRKDPLQVIRDLTDETVRIVHRLNHVFKDEPELDILIKGFIHGYTEFHVLSPRYRLQELGFV